MKKTLMRAFVMASVALSSVGVAGSAAPSPLMKISKSGSVLRTTSTTAIFWGADWTNLSFADDIIIGMDSFFRGYGNSHFAMLTTEYYDRTGPITASSAYLGHVIDTSSPPSGVLNASQVIAEACSMSNNNPDPNGVYFVYTSTEAALPGICAVPMWGTCRRNKPILAVYVPLMSGEDAPCRGVGDTTAATGHSIALGQYANVSAQQLRTMITNPRNNGWKDANGENHFKCDATFPPEGTYEVFTNGSSWKLRTFWSNAAYLNNSGLPNKLGQPGCVVLNLVDHQEAGMKSLRALVVIGSLALSSVLAAQSAPSPEALLKAAINLEVVDGDFTGAMKQYKEIATRYATNHAVASQALLHLAGLYEKQGKPEALPTYRQIVTDYPDTGTTAAAARARVTAIEQAAAGPFKERSLDAILPKDGSDISGSPDGQFIAYVRPKPGETFKLGGLLDFPATVLCVREVANGKEHVLVDTKDAREFLRSVIWSPDSQRIAFVAEDMASGPGRDSKVRLVTVSNREARTITASPSGGVSNITWSPNGRHLAIGYLPNHNGPIEVAVVSINSGAAQPVGPSPQPWSGLAWSSDGSRFAYLSQVAGAGNSVIRVVSTAGAELNTLPIPPAGPTSRTTVAAWTSDNRILITQSVPVGNDFFAIPAGGGEAKRICEGRGMSGGDGCQTYSPDGLWQITAKNVAGGGKLVLRSTVDGTERPLTPEAVSEQAVLGFSPDGRLFAFRSKRDNAWAVYVVPTDRLPAANPVKLAPLAFPGSAAGGWWTPNGLVLRFNDSQTNLYRVTVDPRSGRPTEPTGAPVRLTESAQHNQRPFVSPDGRRIAYVTRAQSGLTGTGYALMEANGSSERVLREVPPDMLARMQLLGWRSSEELVYADSGLGTSGNAPKAIMILNTKTGDLKRGPADLADHVVLVPGLDEVFFSRSGTRTKAVSLMTGSSRELASLVAGPMDDPDIVVSANGQVVAYVRMNMNPAAKELSAEIHVRTIDSNLDKVVARFSLSGVTPSLIEPLALSPDGKYLLMSELKLSEMKQPKPTVRIVDVQTLDSWPLIEDAGDVQFANGSAHWSPDGSFIVIEGMTSQTNWRAYQGVTYEAVTKLMGARR